MTSVTRLDGVGPALEADLSEAGFECLEKLCHANLSVVCEVDSVTPELVLRAQKWMAENHRWSSRPMLREGRLECFCQFCGKGFSSTAGGSTLRVHEKRCAENPEAPDRFK